jgi:hypothetical protein
MRMRIADGEVNYYSDAKRFNKVVRVQGANWRVAGVTADRIPNATKLPTPGAAQGEQQQWWVELSEVR